MAVAKENIGDKVARGAIWAVSMRLIVRLLGLVNVAIYARILTKAEVGLIVLLISLVAILQLLLDSMVRTSLVRIQNLRDEHYGAAFKLRLLGGLVAGVIVALAAGPAANFYAEESLKNSLYVLGAVLVFEGLASSWVVSFQRELQYHKDFIFETVVGVGRILVTIALVVWLRNIWAIVWGFVAAGILRVVLSYIMCWGRSFKSDKQAEREIWQITKWISVEAIAKFAEDRIDRISIAKVGTTGQLAVFSQALDLVMLPIGNLILPIGRAFLPGLHKLREQGEEFIAETYAKAVGAMIALCFPIAFGLVLIADPFVLSLFGDNWPELIFALQLAAPFALAEGVYASLGQVYQAEGHIKMLSLLQWVRVIVFVPSVICGYLFFGIYGAIAAKSIASFALLLPAFYFIIKNVHVKWRFAITQISRSLVASMVMAVIYLLATGPIFTHVPESWLQFVIGGVIGGSGYAVALYLIWMISGRPDGLEQKAFKMLKLA
ncbi:oligosaccharide flippase family protein [Kordiimonas sp. SCSIO 12603]|uniref:oligosaccharide flippase family protein n=1 Tax=Kordiimonas sp. SCSIO 12603 TaxID=2829596 RepID=UPI002106244F|nr:oligosaccharide flippase family protein [Kordiimonas sp. SCSIO 12603]UTW57109.1 oligosaccharide flippase family protein [Kordiimonas sp. SCSIO 12603]